MRVYEGSAELGDVASGCVLTVGNFDGVHLGHQSLLRAVIERGRALGQRTALYTFDPHPRKVLSPEGSPPRLMTGEQLARALGRAGIDVLIREPFTREFASLTPEAFLRDVIRARFRPTELYVGRDFHFGKGRSGSGETLLRLGPRARDAHRDHLAGEGGPERRVKHAHQGRAGTRGRRGRSPLPGSPVRDLWRRCSGRDARKDVGLSHTESRY